jgi:hypothetical protein
MKGITLFLALLLCLQLNLEAHAANPLAQTDGQAYVVQTGDWLSKLADKFYGDPQAWSLIVEATQAKAASDSSFATITDPNLIEVGQKLWIPTVAGTPAGDTAPVASSNPADLQQAYLNAVKDAAIVEPGEISKNLTPVVETNPNLVWEGEAGSKQVLVLTWTSWNGYDDQVGQSIVTTRETWVTVAPELKNFCTTYSTAQPNLTLRLEQLLGLPPANGKTKFVEMWVTPQDLFRPSPDPEITDQEAGLTFPQSKFLTISEEYKAWFNDLSSQSYGENGYPWTRLGYTYDWGNPSSEVGLSEFVINTGATIEVQGVTNTEDYCQ